jgi:hypothetical protein
MEYVIGLICIVVVIFIVIHFRPLREEEIRALGQKRRNKQISQYFSFDSREFDVNKDFKKNMNPNGAFYQINENLFQFPSLASALLKYKKHEWIIVAFEKNKKVNSIWLNKGFDRSAVSLYLSIEHVAELARKEKQTSVMIFHNHPNINPNYYDCRRPSAKDIESASDFAQVLNHNGINLLEFVCERGMHYRYYLSPADNFLPLSEFIDAIDNINGLSRFKNLSLHCERIFDV